jgi:hypothetical protein
MSGKNAQRPELKACHAFLDPGGTLVVPSLDRYGRSLQGLINMVAELHENSSGPTGPGRRPHPRPGRRAPHGGHTEQVIRAARELLPA